MMKHLSKLAVGALLAGLVLGLGAMHISIGRAQISSQAPCPCMPCPPECWKAVQPTMVAGSFAYRPDPAFDQHFSSSFLALAANKADSAMLTDAALQLAHGEHVLRRPHKELPAAGLAGIACRAAAERGDKATLDRLADLAKSLGDKALADKVEAARKLAEQSRSQPALTVSVEDTPVAQYALFHACLLDIRSAWLIGDARMLKALAEAVPQLPLLSAAQKQWLLREMRTAAAAPDAGEAKVQRECRKLLRGHRGSAKPPAALQPRTPKALAQAASGRELSPAERAKAKQLALKLTAASRPCDMGDLTCSGD